MSKLTQKTAVAIREDFKLRSQLERILEFKISDVGWEQLREVSDLFGNISLEDAMHLGQIKKAVEGNTAAYKAIMERAKGKVPSKSIAVTTDYVTFLEQIKEQEMKDVSPHPQHIEAPDDWLE